MLTVKSFQWTSQSSLPSYRLSRNQNLRKIPQFSSPLCHPKKRMLSNSSLLNAAASTTIDPSENDSSFSAAITGNGPEITFGKSGIKLSLYGIIYATIGLSLGFVWYIGLVLCELMYKIIPPWSGKRKGWFDPNRRIPAFMSHLWAVTVLTITGSFPIIKGRENMKTLYDKEKKLYKNAMYVANHTSFMDIYFVAMALGFRSNYKFVAKKELLKLPLLGRAIKVCHHIVLDRTSRRSQLETYKKSVKALKTDGVSVVTFAEGTRSRTGVLGEFKKGAFKMAQSAGVPIVPVSLGYAQDVQPIGYVFPAKPGRFGKRKATIVIGKPVETIGKSDEELLAEVRKTMIENLPESQRPSEN